MLNRMSFLAIVTSLLLSFNLQAANLKIGFVNTPKVLEAAPQAEDVRNILKTEFAPRDAELVEHQKEIQAMEDKLQRDGALMSATEKRNFERDILNKRRDFKRLRDAFAEDLDVRRKEELGKMQRNIAKVVMEFAKSEGYDLIFESGVVFASERVEITGAIIEALKKAYK